MIYIKCLHCKEMKHIPNPEIYAELMTEFAKLGRSDDQHLILVHDCSEEPTTAEKMVESMESHLTDAELRIVKSKNLTELFPKKGV